VGDAGVSNPSATGWFAVAPPGTSGEGCLSTASPTALLNANGCTRGPWNRPAAGTFGNATRNGFLGPQFFNMDASASKKFQFSERIQGQFRAELFNAFNHVNLGQPGASVPANGSTSASFGVITSASAMRKMQFGLQLTF